MEIFQYDPPIFQDYPTLRAVVVHVQKPRLKVSNSTFRERYRDVQVQVRDRLGEIALSDIPSIAAWRGVFRSFGVKPTQYRSAVEALLRRLQKHGDIPSLNPLVDLANWVSIQHALPVAAFDLAQVARTLTVRFAEGPEWFTALHEQEPSHPEPGEVIFADGNSTVHARRWCWRQSRQSATMHDSQEVLFTIEGHHPEAESEVHQAGSSLVELLQEHFTGVFNSAALGPEHPGLAQVVPQHS